MTWRISNIWCKRCFTNKMHRWDVKGKEILNREGATLDNKLVNRYIVGLMENRVSDNNRNYDWQPINDGGRNTA